ncbi:hypothetical protein OFL77_26945, partial [Escherichia coli]|nr:hypothetical protein [Escherichia coli]
RNSPGYAFVDVDDAFDLAGPDDPAVRLEHAREFEARMKALPKDVRKQAEGALAGNGASAERIVRLIEGAPKRAICSAGFDPNSVLIEPNAE